MVGHHLGELTEGGFGGSHVVRQEALLRSIDPGASLGSEEGIVDVDGDGEPAMFGEGMFRWPDLGEADEVGPAEDRRVGMVEELPTQRTGHAESGIVRRTAADADPHVPGTRADGVAEDGTDAEGIEVEGYMEYQDAVALRNEYLEDGYTDVEIDTYEEDK
jgi:hypothetical protein